MARPHPPPMHRRRFLASAASASLAGALVPRLAAAGPGAAGGGRRDDGLVFDAMGELRPEYPESVLRAMLGSGLDAITITLCDPKPEGEAALALAVDELLAHDRFLASRPDVFLKALGIADVDRARAAGKLAVFYMYQNTTQFGTSPDRVGMFHAMGMRACQLTYNTRNHAGVGCWEAGGITEFGRGLIARLNAARVLIDLSHANMTTMAETVAASSAPVIVSHTACMAVHANRRNTTDENLRAVAARGGVIGICQMRPFLTTRRSGALPAYFDHLRHAIDVAGVEHVAIGSDRDYRVVELSPEYLAELKREEGSQVVDADLPYFIDELNGPGRMTVVRDGLRRLGLSAADVDKVMGGNLYRLYREVIG